MDRTLFCGVERPEERSPCIGAGETGRVNMTPNFDSLGNSRTGTASGFFLAIERAA